MQNCNTYQFWSLKPLIYPRTFMYYISKMKILLVCSAVSTMKLMIWWALQLPINDWSFTKKSNCWANSVKSCSASIKISEKLHYEQCWVNYWEFSNLHWIWFKGKGMKFLLSSDSFLCDEHKLRNLSFPQQAIFGS